MIRYKLRCKNCDNSFDSWFASSKEYDKLKNTKNLLKRILIMLETIFRMKQDLCIIIIKKNQKAFMEKQLLTKFQNLKTKESIQM